jgi:hypothetical protein
MRAIERLFVVAAAAIARVEAFKERHARPVRVLQIASFMLLGFYYAGFIPVPDLVVVPLWLSALWPILQHWLWARVVRPRLEQARVKSGG